MKLQNINVQDVVEDSSKTMSIATTPASFTLMLENLYQNPLAAVLRELTTNALDIHKQVGVREKVLIQLPTDTSKDLIIRDFGTGLNAHDIDYYLNRIFSSNKSSDDNSMGGYGLGSKSPLALVDYFEIISFHEGTSYFCVWDKKQGQLPRFDIVHQESTEQPSGIVFRIPLGNSTKISQNELVSLCIKTANKELCTFLPYIMFVENALVPYNQVVDVTPSVISSVPIYEDLHFAIYANRDTLQQTVQPRYLNYINITFKIQVGHVNYQYSNPNNIADFKQLILANLHFLNDVSDLTVYLKVPIGTLEIPMSREIISETSSNISIIADTINAAKNSFLNISRNISNQNGFENYMINKEEIDSSFFKNNARVLFTKTPPQFLEEAKHIVNNIYPFLDLAGLVFSDNDIRRYMRDGNYFFTYISYILEVLLIYLGFKFYKNYNSSSLLSDNRDNILLGFQRIGVIVKELLDYPRVSNKVITDFYKHTYNKEGLGFFTNYNLDENSLKFFKILIKNYSLYCRINIDINFLETAHTIEEIKQYRLLNRVSIPNTTPVSFQGIRLLDSTMSEYVFEYLPYLNLVSFQGSNYNSLKPIYKKTDENNSVIPFGLSYFEDANKPLLIVDKELLSIPINLEDYYFTGFSKANVKLFLDKCNIVLITTGLVERYKTLLDSQGVSYYYMNNKYRPPHTTEITLNSLLEQSISTSQLWFIEKFKKLWEIFLQRRSVPEYLRDFFISFLDTLIIDPEHQNYYFYLEAFKQELLSPSNKTILTNNSVFYLNNSDVNSFIELINNKFMTYFLNNSEEFIKTNLESLVLNNELNSKFLLSYLKTKLEIPE